MSRMLRQVCALALVIAAGQSAAADCTYRYWPQSLGPLDGKDYETVGASGSPYAPSLYADFASYRGLTFSDPAVSSERTFLRGAFRIADDREEREYLLQYIERKHQVRPAEAVILIHGNSAYPDAWFSDSALSQSYGVSYTNYAGSDLYAAGFDVFAPFVTHHTGFQNARRRVASVYGEKWQSLDVHKIVGLFDALKAQGYHKVHIAGLSGGAGLTVLAARELAGDPKLGMSLAVEGWFPMRKFVVNASGGSSSSPQLWLQNWEMSFGPFMDRRDFFSLPPNTYLAYGSCNAWMFVDDYAHLTPRMVITYEGGHEFQMAVWNEAMSRYRDDHGAPPAPPPTGPVKASLDFEEGLIDETGRAWTASNVTIQNGVAEFTGNGLNSGVVTPNDESLQLGSADFRIEVEARFDSSSADNTTGYTIVAARGGVNDIGWSFFHYGGKFTFLWTHDGSTMQSVDANEPITVNQMDSYVIERTGQTLSISINGAVIGSGSISGGIFHSSSSLRLGGDGVNSGGLVGGIGRFKLTVGE